MDLEVIHGEPDGTLPARRAQPALAENRGLTSEAVKKAGPTWASLDGDFDRCFFFERTRRVRGELLPHRAFRRPLPAPAAGRAHLYDPRLTWSTEELVAELGGRPTICRTGHVFFKQALRDQGGVYGGEMSGHHYFSSFGCCDTAWFPGCCS